MFDLYEQGLGTHAIANKTGRSTHTVHSVLTHRGTRSLPERNTEPADEESAADTGDGQSTDATVLGPYRNMGVMISPPPRPRSPEKKPENIPTLKTKTDMFTP